MQKRLFNIAGPCFPGEHYLLPTLERCPEIGRLIESKQYFVVHAARQSGKTTLLKALAADVNGGGQIVREYALGRRRVDLCVHYAGRRYPVEIKLHAGPKTRQEGIEQLAAYCDLCGAHEGWLVVFDRVPHRPWDDRITWEEIQDAAGRTLHLVGC